jgi:hypothetical protein
LWKSATRVGDDRAFGAVLKPKIIKAGMLQPPAYQQHRIRHYGLLASATWKANIAR